MAVFSQEKRHSQKITTSHHQGICSNRAAPEGGVCRTGPTRALRRRKKSRPQRRCPAPSRTAYDGIAEVGPEPRESDRVRWICCSEADACGASRSWRRDRLPWPRLLSHPRPSIPPPEEEARG